MCLKDLSYLKPVAYRSVTDGVLGQFAFLLICRNRFGSVCLFMFLNHARDTSNKNGN